MSSEHAGEIEQVCRVGVALDAGAHHDVVARVLAVLLQARAGEPQQRVEPVDRLQRLGAGLHEPVTTRDMRDFVREDDADALVRPGIGVDG